MRFDSKLEFIVLLFYFTVSILVVFWLTFNAVHEVTHYYFAKKSGVEIKEICFWGSRGEAMGWVETVETNLSWEEPKLFWMYQHWR